MIDYKCPGCGVVHSLPNDYFKHAEYVECTHCKLFSNEDMGFFEDQYEQGSRFDEVFDIGDSDFWSASI